MLSPEEPIVGRLPDLIRFTYVSEFFFDVEYRQTPAGFSWSLIRRAASPAIRKEHKWQPFEEHVPSPRGYLAILSGEPAGYVEFNFEDWHKLIRVWHFYVAEQSRGVGVGREMMNSAVQAARHFGARGIVLETQTSNFPAIEFYRKLGFEPWGINTAAYSNNDIEEADVQLWMGKAI